MVSDIIWASSPPLFTGISGYLTSKLFRRPWVLDVRDLWPESAVAAGQLREGGQAFRIGKLMEKFLYNRARHISCVSKPMQQYIKRMTRTPVKVAYNGVNSSEIDKFNNAKPKGDKKSRVLLYAGNFGRVQALDCLIRAVADLKSAGQMSGWEIHLVGEGVVKDELVALINQLGTSDLLKILPAVARSEINNTVASADALFVSLKPDKVLAMTIPSKLFDCLIAGKPIIAGVEGEGAEIASRSGGNIVYKPDSYEGLMNALVELMNNYDVLKIRATANCALVQESYTREKAVGVLLEVFDYVIRK